jgi:hypothetical protein
VRGFLSDLTYSLRLSRKSPGFSFVAGLCLALGICVNTSVFSTLNFLFFRALPATSSSRGRITASWRPHAIARGHGGVQSNRIEPGL